MFIAGFPKTCRKGRSGRQPYGTKQVKFPIAYRWKSMVLIHDGKSGCARNIRYSWKQVCGSHLGFPFAGWTNWKALPEKSGLLRRPNEALFANVRKRNCSQRKSTGLYTGLLSVCVKVKVWAEQKHCWFVWLLEKGHFLGIGYDKGSIVATNIFGTRFLLI